MKIPFHTPSTAARLTVLATSAILAIGGVASAANKPAPQPCPDLTHGGTKDETHDWNLGATGARGWIYGSKGDTREARQILVTAVAKDTPAAAVLKAGDVILGAGGGKFNDDARVSIAMAITAAESEKGAGRLKIVRWRDGKSEDVELKLPVMGSYSATAPYDCPKSKKIFDAGCQVIAKRGLASVSIPNDLNALALLASGKSEYRPALAEYAKKAAELKGDFMQSWIYGYTIVFLGEYVAATHDQSVMDGLRRLTTEVAKGQSAVGTWGHSFASPTGNCSGYGCMNQPGIVLTLGMVIAREAGVKEPVVDKAIAKSAGFLRWYVNKGAIPYGDHQPWPGHEDNGKCSSATVLFDLLGDRDAASFYARMSTAGYAERERGHTGDFFNILWAMPAVVRCGPLASGSYMKEQSWYYDLAREWDGSFGYQGSPAGEEEHGKYTRWDCTGAYMLAYAMPLKSLYLTGKKACSVPALDAKQVAAVIAAGRDYTTATKATCYDGRKTEELLAGLASWSPAVRKRSGQALAHRDGEIVPQLVKMLASPDVDTRYGACEALGFMGAKADAAAPQLRALLKNPDPWLQSLACQSLVQMGPQARKDSVSDLLRIAVASNPADPRHMVQRSACIALFAPYPGSGGPKSILSESLEGVDRQLLIPAIQSVLTNEDGAARGSLNHVYRNLTDRDVVALLPAIITGIRELAPSNEMFGDGIRLAGLDLVSRLHIREGMPLCLAVMEPGRWGGGKRAPECLECLTRYGAHAKEFLPQLREMRAKAGKQKDTADLFDKTIAAIESSKASPTLVDAKSFVAPAGAK